MTVLCESELVYWLQMYVTYVVVIIIVVIFWCWCRGGGEDEITDCKLNLLGVTSRFCTLTMFVVIFSHTNCKNACNLQGNLKN
jgi:hypothetical protein